VIKRLGYYLDITVGIVPDVVIVGEVLESKPHVLVCTPSTKMVRAFW